MPTPIVDPSRFDSIEDTLAAFKAGEFIAVLDSPDRENEADLIIAASHLTTEKAAFMIRHTSGLLCAPLAPALIEKFELHQMVPLTTSQDPNRTAYTITVDANHPSIATGISAHDRALTARTLADPAATTENLRKPGHILPLCSRPGGIRERRGHTEAATEFCRLAGLPQAGIICEMVEDGEEVVGQTIRSNPGMMRTEATLEFGKKWGVKVCTIEDLVTYVERTEGKLRLAEDANGTA